MKRRMNAAVRALLGAGLLASPRASAAGDQVRSALESFRAAMKDAKSIEDRAVQIQALGWADPSEAGAVGELSRFLVLSAGDINALLPVTAEAALPPRCVSGAGVAASFRMPARDYAERRRASFPT